MLRKRWVAAATLAAAAYAAPAASAETVYGLTDADKIVIFDSATPGTTSSVKNINGLANAETVEGIDVRPATLQLYALGSTGQLYRVDVETGDATAVGAPLTLVGNDFDIDFNPTVDRLRIVSDAEQNLRVNPNTGALVDGDPNTAGTQPDGTLTAPGNVDENVTGAAYTNNAPATHSFPNAPTTTLFDIDTSTDQLFTQNPPNAGTLADGKPLGVDFTGDVGFDIVTAPAALGAVGVNTAFVVGRIADTNDRLYTLDTATGAVTLVGEIGAAQKVKDIAVAAPTPLIAVLYSPSQLGSAQTLVFVRADRPGVAASQVTITGLTGQERLVGIDRQPSSGTVFGISTEEKIYTINLGTGAATQVPAGAPAFTPSLTGTAFGLDFNPIPNVIRLISDSSQNLRVNQTTGAATTDQNLTYAGAPDPNQGTNPSATGAAYTNPVSPAPASTTLFDIDTGNDNLATQGSSPASTTAGDPGNPNQGILNTVGPLGVAVDPGNGYDIVARFNQGFAALRPTTAIPVQGITTEPALFGVNVASSVVNGALTRANGGAVTIGELAGAPIGGTIAGMTVVNDNVLTAPPAPGTGPGAPTGTATPTPTATYEIPTVTPTPTATPTYNVKVKPRITARAKPRRDKKKPFIFRVQGKLTFPSKVSQAAGCKGTVRIVAKKGKKVVAKRRTGIKSTCKYKARVKLRKSAGKRGKVKFKVQFLGNNRLQKASAKTSAKFGKPRR